MSTRFVSQSRASVSTYSNITLGRLGLGGSAVIVNSSERTLSCSALTHLALEALACTHTCLAGSRTSWIWAAQWCLSAPAWPRPPPRWGWPARPCTSSTCSRSGRRFRLSVSGSRLGWRTPPTPTITTRGTWTGPSCNWTTTITPSG